MDTEAMLSIKFWATSKSWVLPLTLVFSLAFSLAGCDSALKEEPKDFVSPTNFYRTPEHAEAAVLGVYEELADWDAFYSSGWIMLDAISDVGKVGPGEANPKVRALGTMTWSPTSEIPSEPWKQFYAAISGANQAITRIPQMPENALGADQEELLINEAKFLRAFSYFYLVRLYGDVPLITGAPDPSTELSRTPVEEVYSQIIADAEAAVGALPAEREQAGRATRGAARALLAKVYLTRENWSEAANYAKQIIDAGNYRLYDDYLRAFLPAYENGPEHIFSLQADGPVTPTDSRFIGLYGPRPLNGIGGGFGILLPTQWHYESYIAGDYRKEVTYADRWINLEKGEKVPVPNAPYVFKYRPSQFADYNHGDVNAPIYRYAEILLIYAEALNEQGRTGEAVQYLNKIRARARNGASGGEARAEPADYTGPMSTDAVREAIFQERRWELAHELKRWFDLVRRGEDYFMSEIEAHDPQSEGLEPTDMRWPIPQTEIDAAGDLGQNPGY
jgi:tetratricopeptide (TPR) repeat protein